MSRRGPIYCSVYLRTGPKAAAAASNLLPLANLGVGLLNLGVSAYTAYKVYKMDQKIDQIGSQLGGLATAVGQVDAHVVRLAGFMDQAVNHLDTVLQFQGLTLAMLVDGQGQILGGLDQLRVEMLHGFEGVNETLISVEARRERLDLDTRMRTLLRHYEVCLSRLGSGEAERTADVRRVVDVATEVTAWLDARIQDLPVGSPRRLPLLVTRAMAMRMEHDARQMEESLSPSQAADIARFLETISNEVRWIIENCSPFMVSVAMAPILAEYVLLSRAFRTVPDWALDASGTPVPLFAPESLFWDDGLAGLRAGSTVNGERVAVEIPLSRLSDKDWYRQWKQLPDEADIPEGIAIAEVVAAAGAPMDFPGTDDGVRALREMVTPQHRRGLQQTYGREFGWRRK